jgi:hypothetical protein
VSTTVNGITCEEIVEGIEEGIAEEGPYATKKWLCAWSDRYALANSFLGFVSHTGGQNGSVEIHGPIAYPESNNMLARTVQIQGKGKPSQGAHQIQFPQAVVTVTYGVPSWQAIPNPDMSIDPTQPFVYATQDIDFGREMLSLPGSSLRLANGNTLEDTPFAIPIPYAVFSITLQRVPFLPAQAIYTALRRPLNQSTFLGIQPGYLRFDGCKNHAEASTDGTYVQSLAYVFAARTLLRWDETYDKNGTGGPQQVRYNGSAVLLRTEFAPLFPSNYYG